MPSGSPVELPRLCILILQYNGAPLTLQLLESLARWEGPWLAGYRVIVMDNASREPRQAEITAAHPYVEFRQFPENLGFGRAHNRILPEIAEPYLLLLNNDCILLNDAVHRTLEQVVRDKAQFGTCTLLNEDGSLQVNYAGIQTPLRRILWSLSGLYRIGNRLQRIRSRARVGYANGAFLLLETARVRRIGLFDDRYFMYSEDLDLMVRLHFDGARGYRYAGGRVVHLGGASTGRLWTREEVLVKQVEQQVECMRRHFPGGQVRLWVLLEWLSNWVRGWVSPQARLRSRVYRSCLRAPRPTP